MANGQKAGFPVWVTGTELGYIMETERREVRIQVMMLKHPRFQLGDAAPTIEFYSFKCSLTFLDDRSYS